MSIVLARVISSLGLFAVIAGCRDGAERAPGVHHHELNLPPVGPSIAVSLADKSVNVDLSSVTHEPGSNSLALASIWRAAFPSDDPAPLHFDLVGSDGFRPTSRPKCTQLLSGAEVAKAHMDPVTHNVSYDADLQLPGCYRVRAVVRIEGVR